jgi:hypothetical protein
MDIRGRVMNGIDRQQAMPQYERGATLRMR